jgi:hypothetical protein
MGDGAVGRHVDREQMQLTLESRGYEVEIVSYNKLFSAKAFLFEDEEKGVYFHI